MAARIHLLKLGFLCRLLASEHDTLASRTFHTLASQDIYRINVAQQCIFLDSKLGTNATASILSNIEDPKALLRKAKQAIIKQDNKLRLQVAAKHQSVKLALNINWLRVWENARDKGPYWTRITQSFFKVLTPCSEIGAAQSVAPLLNFVHMFKHFVCLFNLPCTNSILKHRGLFT